jgi:methylated-DNA-protein-cysteine methyltransferase-like protein
MNNSHLQTQYVPAHRVVNRNGLLTGKHHFGTPEAMRELLENEGVVIEEDLILNFREIFWDPAKELSFE